MLVRLISLNTLIQLDHIARGISEIGDAVAPFRRVARRLNEWDSLRTQLLVRRIDIFYAENERDLIPPAERQRPRSDFNRVVCHWRFKREADVSCRKLSKRRRLIPVTDFESHGIAVKQKTFMDIRRQQSNMRKLQTDPSVQRIRWNQSTMPRTTAFLFDCCIR